MQKPGQRTLQNFKNPCKQNFCKFVPGDKHTVAYCAEACSKHQNSERDRPWLLDIPWKSAAWWVSYRATICTNSLFCRLEGAPHLQQAPCAPVLVRCQRIQIGLCNTSLQLRIILQSSKPGMPAVLWATIEASKKGSKIHEAGMQNLSYSNFLSRTKSAALLPGLGAAAAR